MSLSNLRTQPVHTLELCEIARDDNHTPAARMTGNEKIVAADDLALPLQHGVNVSCIVLLSIWGWNSWIKFQRTERTVRVTELSSEMFIAMSSLQIDRSNTPRQFLRDAAF